MGVYHVHNLVLSLLHNRDEKNVTRAAVRLDPAG
jgi:hypothetical protein